MDQPDQPADAPNSVSAERPDGNGAAEEPSALGEPNAVSAAALAAEIAELKAQLATVSDQAEERLAAWQRAQADYDNLKKRSQQEVQERVERSAGALVLALLPVVDDFERAIEAEADQAPAAWVDGIRLIQRKLYQFLEQCNVQPIAAEGQPFDPNFHQALGQAPGPAGQVLTQVQKGYLIGPRVLRPSQVIVGAGEAENDSAQEGDESDADRAPADGAG
ncbi:MAG: nucleotide exchange factor GrpE [Dehalococcoidia bacterium]